MAARTPTKAASSAVVRWSQWSSKGGGSRDWRAGVSWLWPSGWWRWWVRNHLGGEKWRRGGQRGECSGGTWNTSDMAFGGEIWTCHYDVPAGPHGQHTQASTQRNDENGAAWWAHLEDQLQAGGRLRWLLWVGVQWWCLWGLGLGRAGRGGASSLTPLRRSCTSRSMCVDIGNLGWFTDGYKFMSLQERCGRRAFSAKGGPLLRTHWPRTVGKFVITPTRTKLWGGARVINFMMYRVEDV